MPIIEYQEDSKIFDILEKFNKKSGLSYGWVQAFLDKQIIYNGPNLIVSKGREFQAQKLFQISNIESGLSRTILYDHKVSHFAIGSGGASSPTNIYSPQLNDENLTYPITLNGTTVGTKSSLLIDSPYANGNVTYEALDEGVIGDSIAIKHIDPGIAGVLSISVISKHIEITLSHDGTNVISTANDIVEAITNNIQASALVTATAEGTGVGRTIAFDTTYLSGGQDYEQIYLEEPSHYVGSDDVHNYRNSVKPITTDGDVYLHPDAKTSYSNQYYTKVKCTCIVPNGEPSSLGSGESVEVSEAGLYFVNENLANSEPDKVQLFSRICFEPRELTKENVFTLLWYILC